MLRSSYVTTKKQVRFDWFTSLFNVRIETSPYFDRYNPVGLLGLGPRARGFCSVVKHSTADPGIASSIPPHSN